ncbi:hypothetical protein HELRODRAFT_171371 [Helobdella robusta]|uniref:Uncharacterized protein n=1 Tax=Helobdella robusta TaxID=6412 RepID=T1F470_HELRO|nr:hypothetical protein HELRODRAFT_171371 [Helobdella robusta]ESO05709.1 hypothetical protein HELRODRAFT_171371 [Helobdella robusta]
MELLKLPCNKNTTNKDFMLAKIDFFSKINSHENTVKFIGKTKKRNKKRKSNNGMFPEEIMRRAVGELSLFGLTRCKNSDGLTGNHFLHFGSGKNKVYQQLLTNRMQIP